MLKLCRYLCLVLYCSRGPGQAEFFNHAVQAILELYNDWNGSSSMKSVMVVGHSLGGMVTR